MNSIIVMNKIRKNSKFGLIVILIIGNSVY